MAETSKPRMFQSDWMEALSRTHPLTPVVAIGPLVLYLLYRTFWVLRLAWASASFFLAMGWLAWSLSEYLLHRFVFHYQPKSAWGKRLHFIMHGVHHEYPADGGRLVMPPTISLTYAAVFYPLCLLGLGPHCAPPFFAGYAVGYIFYDEIHYILHHWNIKSEHWLALKKHHLRHHFADDHSCFGVSNTLWDRVFGTTYRKEKS